MSEIHVDNQRVYAEVLEALRQWHPDISDEDVTRLWLMQGGSLVGQRLIARGWEALWSTQVLRIQILDDSGKVRSELPLPFVDDQTVAS